MEPTHTPLGQHVIPYSLVFLLALGVLTAFGGAGETPRKGGTIRVGMIAEPYTLDMHWQPEGTGQLIAYHFLEGLYTQGLDYGWIPMLAEGHTVSEDGLVYTIKLRRGVPFHHGKELTAADAVASLQRYGRLTAGGRRVFQRVESVKVLDQYTVQLRLQGKTSLVLSLLRTAIYPKEIVEEAGEGQTPSTGSPWRPSSSWSPSDLPLSCSWWSGAHLPGAGSTQTCGMPIPHGGG